jgi:murein tripeptide amidase MpaA
MLVDTLDIFILPLVNPDGRVYVQSPTGDAFWRKNRNPDTGLPCQGIDLNRNYDCLWSSGIGTSADSCSDAFRGSNAFSEPETRNVRHLLDDYPHITGMIDVHSFLELVLYPWGDDDNQSTDPSMNFTNPAYDGIRGTAGDSIYRDYMPQTDDDWFATTGEKIKDAIAAVRGRVYTVLPSINLYPTSGTSENYAYSRHFVGATKRKVFAYTVETGTEFQPPYSEALNIISEVSSGLVEFSVVVTRERSGSLAEDSKAQGIRGGLGRGS